MDIFEQTIFLIGGAWTCLVGFLVLGMYSQNYYTQQKARTGTAGGKFLTATAMNRSPLDIPTPVASSHSATQAGGANQHPKEDGLKTA